MSPRLVSPWKRPNSSFYWFRIVVPARYRRVVGKGEIKQSLNTTDLREARRLCAIRQREWLKRFEAIEAELVADAGRLGIQAVDRHFEAESQRYGGRDRVVAHELECAAEAESAMLPTFSPDELGLEPGTCHPLLEASYPDYIEDAQRKAILLRRSVLQQQAAILPGAEAVDRALAVQAWEVASHFLHEAFRAAGLDPSENDRLIAVAAEHYLRRLAGHPLPAVKELRAVFPLPQSIGPKQSAEAVPTSGSELMAMSPAESGPAPLSLREQILGESAKARTVAQVFEAWAAAQPRESHKLCDEWRVAIRRFVELFGDLDVADITSDTVLDFREAMRGLPSRSKRAIAALPLLKQIEVARRDGLKCLSGPTVGKLVSGLRVTLAYACDPLRLIKVNPAAGVSVADATSDPDARLPFEPQELSTIFSSQLMLDPRSKLSATEFWMIVLAPLTGLRIEEMAKFRPENVKCENGIWYFRVERDSRLKRRKQAAAGEASKRSKTSAAHRGVPIHWILLEAGFVEWVDLQRVRNCKWLFDDLSADKYGSRSKYASRRIIRAIRKLGITDEEKVFYSFRHAMKRACRETSMKEEIADLLAGHAPASVGRKYGAGAALRVLKEAVDLIDYPSIDWDPIIAAGKRRLVAE